MIKEALFDIGEDKTPRLDGYPSAFFKTNWDIIKEDFLATIHEFFHNGCILKQINYAAIVLVPKTKHELTAADFRPISCCN